MGRSTIRAPLYNQHAIFMYVLYVLMFQMLLPDDAFDSKPGIDCAFFDSLIKDECISEWPDGFPQLSGLINLGCYEFKTSMSLFGCYLLSTHTFYFYRRRWCSS